MNQRIYAGSYSITWDDAWHRIEVNGYILNLSPTQYRICRAFLAANKVKNNVLTEELVILAYRAYDQLQSETELSRSMLSKHISNLNARILASGLQLRSFQSGYLLTFSSNSLRNLQKRNEGGKDHHGRESIQIVP